MNQRQKKAVAELSIGIGTVLILGFGLHLWQEHNAKTPVISQQLYEYCSTKLHPEFQQMMDYPNISDSQMKSYLSDLQQCENQ